MPDYIPKSDANFDIWQLSLVQIISDNKVAWGIPDEDIQRITTSQAPWMSAFAKASIRHNRTSADVQAKHDCREAYDDVIRGFVAQWLSNNIKVTDSDRERMGLTVRSDSHTPVPVPDSIPVATIDFSVRWQHTVNYVDADSPRSKAKPLGVFGCEIWIKTGDEPPKDSSELRYLTTCTRTPFKITFEGADVGKTAYYWLRWVNRRGQQGPWSSMVSAMIVG